MKISQKVQTRINEFCDKNRIDLFIIFGSYVKNKQRESSDIDIGLLSKKKLNKLHLIVELEIIFQKEIDIVILTSEMDPLLRYEILFTGENVFERKPGLFCEEQLKSWKFYIDTKKIRNLRNQSIEQYVRKIKGEIGSTR